MGNNISNAINNSEILLIYEARLCNPNGDPDDENRPRIDPRTRINLVSDVRLKRFFRNYIIEKCGEDTIWVSTVEGKHVDATDRLNKLLEQDGNKDDDIVNTVLQHCIDARLFGATIPLKSSKKNKKNKKGQEGKESSQEGKDSSQEGKDSRGKSYSITGPVQFTWGYSLHPVELVDSSTITSMFKGRETEAEAGTIGKDYRVYYSLISFYGVINGMRARYSLLKENDIKILDNMLWESIVIDATTRSKIGHTPHLYMRIEYKEGNYLHGDLRKYIQTSQQESIRDLKDLDVKLDSLKNYLDKNKDKINAIYVRNSEDFQKQLEQFNNFVKLPHNNITLQ